MLIEIHVIKSVDEFTLNQKMSYIPTGEENAQIFKEGTNRFGVIKNNENQQLNQIFGHQQQ